MKPLDLALDDPRMQPLVTALNDLVVRRIRDHSPEDFGAGQALVAVFGCKLVAERTLFDSDGLPLSEVLEYPLGDGTFARWTLAYTWDSDEKIQEVRLTGPNGKLAGRWLARWEWEGTDLYGGEYFLDRWDFQTR